MSAIDAESHRTRTHLLNALGWLVCFAATLVLALAAADRHGGDPNFYAGYAVGRLAVAFAIAFAVGLGIQWGARKRRTVPVWIGAIAVGVAAVGLLATAGNQAAAAACVPPARAYGRPPAGWTYAPPTGATRARIMRVVRRSDSDVTHVMLARHGASTVVLFVSPKADESYVKGFEHGAREHHATVTHTAYGATVAEYPSEGVRTIVGLRGCNAVLATGRDDAGEDTVARAIFR